ncbi:NAD(P)/FAD-dependent oxidoreductase [Streptomyces leeuwenhoekii]|uniref:NAD(P)/FAD-dependent oxidoreductase n=2 Tax=Streptomyces leeuwenhoekii TaxID=1437453 RepID=UPI00369A7B78
MSLTPSTEPHPTSVVIVGAGHAGMELAGRLREQGFTGRVDLLDQDSDTPYERPPLTKEFLTGPQVPHSPLRRPAWFDEHRITLHRHGVTAIDPEGRGVKLDSGRTLSYDVLVLATGAQPRKLPVAGGQELLTFRTSADAAAIRNRLVPGSRLTVVGAGFLGLELAAAARSRDVAVSVLTNESRPLGRLAPDVSAAVGRIMRELDVELLCEARLVSVTRRGGTTSVSVEGRPDVTSDLAVASIGVSPRIKLAARCGLAVSDGIETDQWLRTSDPSIHALGDCASFPDPEVPGGRIRIESVPHAQRQARYLADRITGKTLAPFTMQPWFWSHWGEHRLNIAGFSRADDHLVVRGDPSGAAFSVFRFRPDGRLGAVESLNRNREHLMARRLLATGRTVVPEHAADVHLDLADTLRG